MSSKKHLNYLFADTVLLFYSDFRKNWGDYVNPFLIQEIIGKTVVSSKRIFSVKKLEAKIFGIGSILNIDLTGSVIWGSGLIKHPTKKIAFLGWAFKKDTNDTRESKTIYVADYIMNEHPEIVVYDPKVSKERIYADLEDLGTHSSEGIRDRVKVVNTAVDACKDAHAVSILTEWDEFKDLDWQAVYDDMLKPAFLFDGRRLLNKAELKKVGFEVFVIGN